MNLTLAMLAGWLNTHYGLLGSLGIIFGGLEVFRRGVMKPFLEEIHVANQSIKAMQELLSTQLLPSTKAGDPPNLRADLLAIGAAVVAAKTENAAIIERLATGDQVIFTMKDQITRLTEDVRGLQKIAAQEAP